MNQYHPPGAPKDAIRDTVDRCLQSARNFRVGPAVTAAKDRVLRFVELVRRHQFPDVIKALGRAAYNRFMGLEKSVRMLIGSVAAVLMLTVFVTSTTGAQWNSRTWEGTWSNRAYNSGGNLKCVAKEIEPGKWEGTFSGVWKDEPYSYKVSWTCRPGRTGTFALSGRADIDDHNYRWSGIMRDKTLRGRYNSTVGYQGEFVLNEK